MATSIENLYSKLLQAEESLGEFSLQLISNLGSGKKSRKSIKEFNLLSAWIGILKDKIKFKQGTTGKSPSPITITDVSASAGQAVTLGVDDSTGAFFPLFNISSYNSNTVAVDIQSSADSLSRFTGITFFEGKFTFPKTDRFNGRQLSHNLLSEGEIVFSPEVITGGVSPDVYISNLTSKNIKEYNTLLDIIAIKLNLVYMSYERVDIEAMSTNRNSLGVPASTAIISPSGDALRDETGSTLEL